jgi:hypothetical protein
MFQNLGMRQELLTSFSKCDQKMQLLVPWVHLKNHATIRIIKLAPSIDHGIQAATVSSEPTHACCSHDHQAPRHETTSQLCMMQVASAGDRPFFSNAQAQSPYARIRTFMHADTCQRLKSCNSSVFHKGYHSKFWPPQKADTWLTWRGMHGPNNLRLLH